MLLCRLFLVLLWQPLCMPFTWRFPNQSQTCWMKEVRFVHVTLVWASFHFSKVWHSHDVLESQWNIQFCAPECSFYMYLKRFASLIMWNVVWKRWPCHFSMYKVCFVLLHSSLVTLFRLLSEVTPILTCWHIVLQFFKSVLMYDFKRFFNRKSWICTMKVGTAKLRF